MEAIWKQIFYNDKETHYAVNQFGAVKNTETDFIIRPQVNTSGYLEAQIYVDGKPKKIGLHRLVAQAFIPNPDNKPEVNHIDGIKINNSVDNLEWVTREENIQHSWNIGLRTALRGEDSPTAKITEETAKFICMCLVAGMHPLEIEKTYGISHYISSDIARKKTWKHVSDNYPIPKPLKHGDFKFYHPVVDFLIMRGYTNDEIRKLITFEGMSKSEIKSLLKNRHQALKKRKHQSS